jgi:hypothetical protein
MDFQLEILGLNPDQSVKGLEQPNEEEENVLSKTAPEMEPAIGYRILRCPAAKMGSPRGAVFDYVLAANGLWVHGRRDGLEACLPIAECVVRGRDLHEAQPFVRLDYPKLSRNLINRLLARARQSLELDTLRPLETLFWLRWEEAANNWRVSIPPQTQDYHSVRPLPEATEVGSGWNYDEVLIEIHTHPYGPVEFSPQDDEEERSGFRIYGVLSYLFERPRLRFRVGLHGYLYEFPTAWLVETTRS